MICKLKNKFTCDWISTRVCNTNNRLGYWISTCIYKIKNILIQCVQLALHNTKKSIISLPVTEFPLESVTPTTDCVTGFPLASEINEQHKIFKYI